MSAHLVDRLAQHIRTVDPDNRLSAVDLGAELRGEVTEYAIEDFVYDANAGVGYQHLKRLGGTALAEAIVAEFKLDEEK